MGQYYRIVNLDKRQALHPHKAGDGLKLMEFAPSGNVTQLLTVLLASGNNRGGGDLHTDNPLVGSWAGDRIAVVGDYDDPGKYFDVLFPTEDAKELAIMQMAKPSDETAITREDLEEMNVYRLCSEGLFTDITDDVIRAIVEAEGKYSPYFYVDMNEDGWRQIPTYEMMQYAEKNGITTITSKLFWDLHHGRVKLEA